jgi:hypothetical protein
MQEKTECFFSVGPMSVIRIQSNLFKMDGSKQFAKTRMVALLQLILIAGLVC